MASHDKESGSHRDLYVNNDSNLLLRRLDALYGVVATAMRDHNNLLCYRFDLRLNKSIQCPYDDADVISRFMRKLGKLWDSSKRGKLHYIWCKETEEKKGPAFPPTPILNARTRLP